MLKYEVIVKGKRFIADVCLEGYRLCLKFINENGDPNVRYTIKIIEVKGEI